MSPSRRSALLSPWDLATAVGLLALAGAYLWAAPLLPERVPTHFNALGQANGWTPKAALPWLLFGGPVLVWLILWGIDAAAGLVPLPGGQPRVGIAALRGLLGLGMAILMGTCIAIPLHGLRCLWLGLTCFVACLGVGVGILARDSVRALREAGVPDRYRWGLFYVNPEDPRLWVPKRLGLGWTLNFARPAAFWVMALLLTPLLVALAAMLGR